MQNITATFKAYIGTDKNLLVDRLIDVAGWSHIESQPMASAEINHVEIKVFFKGSKRTLSAIRKATFFGGWRLQNFSLS